MIGISVKHKFNANRIIIDSGKATPKALIRAGAYTRGIALRSIATKKNPDVASPTGHQPYNHVYTTVSYSGRVVQHKGFKPTLLFALSLDKRSVVVGPYYKKRGLQNAMRVNEYGGRMEIIKVNDPYHYKHGFKNGEIGPVTRKWLRKGDKVIFSKHERSPFGNHDKVFYIILKERKGTNDGLLAYSSKLYRALERQRGRTVNAFYPARPFMRPALARSLQRLPQFWKNTLGNFSAIKP